MRKVNIARAAGAALISALAVGVATQAAWAAKNDPECAAIFQLPVADWRAAISAGRLNCPLVPAARCAAPDDYGRCGVSGDVMAVDDQGLQQWTPLDELVAGRDGTAPPTEEPRPDAAGNGSGAGREEPRTEGAPPMTASCREWITWMVDGNQFPPNPSAGLMVKADAIREISRACLGREPDPKNEVPLPSVADETGA